VDTWEELTQARAGGAAVLPSSLPPAFRELVARCLVDEPDRRPIAAEVGETLATLAGAQQPTPETAVTARPVAPLAEGHDAVAAAVTGPDPARGPAHRIDGPADSDGPANSDRPANSDGPARSRPGRDGPGSGDSGGGRRSRSGRRVLWSGIVALAVSVLAIFVSLGSSRQTDDAGRSPAATPPQASPSPAAPVPPPAPATPRTAVTTTAPLTVDVALARVRSALAAGREQGQIRPDVAVDLANLLRPLDGADADAAGDQVAEVRRKLDDRVQEGSVDAARADILRRRLADLEQALGSG
jgi:hypothetical protein